MENIIYRTCQTCKKQFDKPVRFRKYNCPSCYNKSYRSTEKGKECTRKYNDSIKGIQARERYQEKKRLLKPPKPPKQNCKCGKMSIAKGFCRSCYNRSRNIKILKSFNDNFDTEKVYKEVLQLVKNGFTIQKACKHIKVPTRSFYSIISPMQKVELKSYKVSIKKRLRIQDDILNDNSDDLF